MDIMTSLIYETAIRSTIKTEVEHYVLGTCKVWFNKRNDSISISILDAHNRPWTYEEYDLQEKLFDGIDSIEIARKAVRAFERKIFKEYFK